MSWKRRFLLEVKESPKVTVEAVIKHFDIVFPPPPHLYRGSALETLSSTEALKNDCGRT